jgi:hypothetical protein
MPGISMYFMGTGKDRSQSDQLFPLFHDTFDPGTPGESKFLFDGPGSQGRDGSAWNPLNWKSRLLGTSHGESWRTNVRDALKQLEARYRGSGREIVNLIGHSRGAVTCHMTAHVLARRFPGWTVRIFAIDPVPGGEFDFSTINPFDGLKLTGIRPEVIPENVSEYVQILMENDANPMFGVIGPNQLSFAGRTHARKLAMPGKHGDCVKSSFNAYPASRIAAGVLSGWLIDGRVQAGYTLRSPAFAEAYAQLWLQKRVALGQGKWTASKTSGVKRAGMTAATVVGGAAVGGVLLSPTLISTAIGAPIMSMTSSYWKNDRSADVPNSQRGDPLYLNSHHKSALMLCPAFVAVLAALSQQNAHRVGVAMRQLSEELPDTYEVLSILGY